MLRNCSSKVRGLSHMPTRRRLRELSSLNIATHSEGVGYAAGYSQNTHTGSKTVTRSLSTGREPSWGQKRSSASQRRPRQATVSLDEAAQHIAFLERQLSDLEYLPPVWMTAETSIDSVDERAAIFQEAKNLLGRIEDAVQKQQLNPSGKHGRELSHLLGQILEVYSKAAVPFEDGTSIFDACCSAMTLLQEWNLDLRPQHYACAVEIAARESRWKEASYLFWEQIDPEAHGHTPMEISSYLAVGLYVVARNSQIEGGSTVDHVMDAVLRMSMVCPTDQDHYVLSAGLALGHAGEGESFAKYMTDSYNRSRLGQPLTAAVMNACILDSRPDKALEVFDELNSDPLGGVSEWQYGGQYGGMNPLCRDVAIRALGATSRENLSELALELYQQVRNDECQISVEALCGVSRACERDGRWREAVELLIEVLDGCHDSHWLVSGKETMAIVSVEEAAERDSPATSEEVLERAIPELGSLLSSVVRSCNAAEKFGIALLCCHLSCDTLRSINSTAYPRSGEVKPLSNILLSCFKSHDELLSATMASLCGLDCYQDAVKLYTDASESFPAHPLYDAHDCSKFAQASCSHFGDVLPVPWESAYRHIQLLTNGCALVETRSRPPNSKEIQMLAAVLGNAMKACTAAGQPEVSLLLTKRADRAIAHDESDVMRPFSIGSAVASFFGLQEAQPTRELDADEETLLSDTTVLAETIRAYRAMNMPEEGLALLDKFPESFGSDNASVPSQRRGPHGDVRWTPVVNQAISLLSDQNRIDGAHALFKATNHTTQNHETLIAMATAFEQVKQWNEIMKLYFYAQDHGLLSEQLGVLAMKAAVETAGKDQAHQLRVIAKSVSELAGLKEKRWLESRYWSLERYLGWNPIRLLMWWSDPATAEEMKLHFAIEQTESRHKAGLNPKSAALWFIVNSVRRYTGPTDTMPFSKEQWLDLLLVVLAEAEHGPQWNSPSFVESACMSLCWLGGYREAVEFACNAVARGVRITHATAEVVTEIAQAEGLETGDLSLLSSRVAN